MQGKVMRYAGDSRADSHIAAQVALLARTLVDRAPSACAVYLSGSFGRGEGSVIRWGDTWRPLGDFDFYVVGTAPLEASALANLLRLLWERRHGGPGPSFGITVDVTRESSLGGLPPDTSTYEFSRLARLVWGREVRKRITFDRQAIPVLSGTRALLNKLVGLMDHAPWAEGFSSMDMEYEVWKLYLDAVAALLLMEGRYVSGYRHRGSVFRMLPRAWRETGVSDLRDKAEWALERKLRPAFSTVNPSDLWDDARNDLAALLRHTSGLAGSRGSVGWLTQLPVWLRLNYYEGWMRTLLLRRVGSAPAWLVHRSAALARRKEARRFGAPGDTHVPAALYGAAAWCLYDPSAGGLAEAGRLLRTAGIVPGSGREDTRSTVLEAFRRYRRTKPSKRGLGL
jgi:hypothetical protein